MTGVPAYPSENFFCISLDWTVMKRDFHTITPRGLGDEVDYRKSLF